MIAKEQIDNLVAELNFAGIAYYVYDAPVMPDSVYDLRFRELQLLEKEHPELVVAWSPTQRVGAPLSGALQKIKHTSSMQSLDNAMTETELTTWLTRVGIEVFSAQPKIDGLSLSLIYLDGVLQSAATRGNGTTGEDVTANARTVKTIPLYLPEPRPEGWLVVRGEVYIPLADFPQVNEERVAAGDSAFANPRNAAAGSLRQQNPAETAKRKLAFVAYGLEEPAICKSDADVLGMLATLGFDTVSPYSVTNVNAEWVRTYFTQMATLRENLPYDIDGIVVKAFWMDDRAKLGLGSRTPHWAIAGKFAAEQAETTLQEIEITVGRTGAITPTAVFDAVELGGTTVTRATLHNGDQIARLGLCLGDAIIVEKAGEVIPAVVGVNESLRDARCRPFQMPTECPSCGGKLEQRKAILFCVNDDCPSRVLSKLVHFVSRGAMNIPGLGEKQLETFVDAGLIQDVADLYSLRESDISGLSGFGASSAKGIVTAIQASKRPELWRFIFSLGVPNVGTTTSHHFQDTFGTLDRIMEADWGSLEAITDVGEVVAGSWFNFAQGMKGRTLVQKLKGAGVAPFVPDATGGALAGLTIVFTGTLSIPRVQAQKMAEAMGAKIGSGISASTDYLVAGDKAGGKRAQAGKLGVKVLDEDGFKRMAGLGTTDGH